MSMRPAIEEAKKGITEVVILAMLEQESHHGYEIARLIEQRSGGTLRFTLASLYARLYRMEDRGWIRGDGSRKPASGGVATIESPTPVEGRWPPSVLTGAGSSRR